MRKLPLFKILRKFSPQDWKKFRTHLKKQYGGQQVILNISNFLKDHYPAFDAPNFEHNHAFKKIFKNQVYSYKQLQNKLGDFKKYTLAFIRQETLEKESYEKDYLLLQAYKDYQLDDFFNKQLQKMKRELDDEQQESPQIWSKKMQLAHEHYYHPSTERIGKEKPSIHEAMESLDIFYAISKLRYTCELVNRKNVLQEDYKAVALLDEVQQIPGIKDNLLFQLYHRLLQNLENKDENAEEEKYTALKELIISSLEKIGKEDQLIVLALLINYMSRLVKSGKSKYLAETLELYQYGITQQTFVIGGYFEKDCFSNIVDTACKLKRFGWAQQFIDNHKNSLDQSIQEEITLLAEAGVLFAQDDFEGVVDKLKTAKGVNVHQEIRLRLLLISSYFELNKFDETISTQCRNFKQFLTRNQTINSRTKKAVLNYIFMVQKLQNPNVDKNKLVTEIKEKNSFYFRRWLLRKIDLLQE